MKTIKIILSLSLLFTLNSCASLKPYNYQLQPKAKKSYRLTTYNVNWGKGIRRIKDTDSIVKAIINTHSDIILLQETTAFWQKIITPKLRHQFPIIIFKHYHSAGGLALLSKYPIHTTFYGTNGIGWHPVWIFTTKTPIGTVQIVNVHLHPPLVAEGNMGLFFHAAFTTGGKRRREIKFIAAHLNKKFPTIIAGDFNEGDRGYAVKWLRNHGFIDALKLTNTRFHTWEWHYALWNFHDRFDRVFFFKPLKLVNLQVVHWGSSDHYPVVADFS